MEEKAKKQKTNEPVSPLMERLVSLAKRRGFIYAGSEIYGGLGGTWDYGPLGVELKNNIKKEWWKRFVSYRRDMYGIDSSILMNSKVWEASGHLKNFVDPMVDCKKCKGRFRADKIDVSSGCPTCGAKDFTEARPFNMMFKTHAGPVEDSGAEVYLRPETAQGMFVNFKNVIDSFHPKLPFGIAQIGKAFRNEITPGNFIFRTREFEQMEIEYFIKPGGWESQFDYWLGEMRKWTEFLGIAKGVSEREVSAEDRAHYSKRTIDIDFEFPFGKEELYGLAYRTDFDLKNHIEKSGIDLVYYNEETKKKLVPHVIEPTFGVDRTMLAVLLNSFAEEEVKEGEIRAVLKFPARLAPVKVAVFPLVSNKENILAKAEEVHGRLKESIDSVRWDDIGNIGKRYRRQDEIGTPWCVTVDYQTLEDGTVTVRDRDTMKQERIAAGELAGYFHKKLSQ
ncbi:MAG: Glycine-tRNA ligase [Parcubacteria group bacterium GW2011_GWA2_47_10]|nr:MAG: Glycine-tRNA ligase [Parcubacteria group bacterium GW2011_GWA2_47_10]